MTRKCIVCGSGSYKTFTEVNVVVCQNCGFGMRASIPEQDKLNTIYKKDYFDDKKNLEYEKDAIHRFRYLTKYFFKNAKILDFGCGMGQFARECKKAGYDIHGYDVSKYAAQHLRENLKIPSTSSPLKRSTFSTNQFDFIVLFDVIEHIKDYEKVIQYFYIWLKPGGTLIMTTPNISSWDAKLFKQKWESFHKIPEHIYFFSPQSLKQTLQKKGFGNVEVKSWGFVRSIGFVMDKEFWGSGSLVKGSRNFLKRTGLYDVFIYFKMHNMMVIAHKN